MSSTRLFPQTPVSANFFNTIFRLKKVSDGITSAEHQEMMQLAQEGKQGIFVYKADMLAANQKGFEICLDLATLPTTAHDVYELAMKIYAQLHNVTLDSPDLQLVIKLLEDAAMAGIAEAAQDLIIIEFENEEADNSSSASSASPRP